MAAYRFVFSFLSMQFPVWIVVKLKQSQFFTLSFPLPEFGKSATTATILPTETMMDRAFGWVVVAPFFRW